ALVALLLGRGRLAPAVLALASLLFALGVVSLFAFGAAGLVPAVAGLALLVAGTGLGLAGLPLRSGLAALAGRVPVAFGGLFPGPALSLAGAVAVDGVIGRLALFGNRPRRVPDRGLREWPRQQGADHHECDDEHCPEPHPGG